MQKEPQKQNYTKGKLKKKTAVLLSSDKGKHAGLPKCELLQINILPMFVWEKRPSSPWEQHLSQELEAHAVPRKRPHHSSSREGQPRLRNNKQLHLQRLSVAGGP